jgi:hypothetical protein
MPHRPARDCLTLWKNEPRQAIMKLSSELAILSIHNA